MTAGAPFFAWLAQVLDEHVRNWRLAVRTLSDRQLAAELEQLRGQCRPDEIGPADLLASIYRAEVRRRISRPPTSSR
jgi:hypothetical protein